MMNNAFAEAPLVDSRFITPLMLVLFIGMLAWVVRYGLWSFGAGETPVAWMVLGGILLTLAGLSKLVKDILLFTRTAGGRIA